jgi:hypothetical protein
MVTDPKLIDGGAAVDGCDPEQPETSRTAAAPTAAAGNAADIRYLFRSITMRTSLIDDEPARVSRFSKR